MKSTIKFVWIAIAALAIAYSMLWGSLAMWFKLPMPDFVRYLAIGIFLIPGLFTIVHLFTGKTRIPFLVYSVFFAALFAWWQTLDPPAEGDWAPDAARQVTGTIQGDQLTLTNVREFQWRSREDFTENWTTRTYDMSKLESADLFLSYWGDPKMAHFMMSFGFGNDEYLAWSIEVRRLRNGTYSPVADFFKANPLVVFAAAESDVVGVRSNVRGEDVHIFRLDFSYDDQRSLLEEYVKDANLLANEPMWYNSVFTNCTTAVFKMLAMLGEKIPFDYRMVVNGYLPEFLHHRQVVNTDISVEELRALGRIKDRALKAGLTEGYSTAIREGVPHP